MVTPMGAIYTTNITPDPETGIGGLYRSRLRQRVAQGCREGRSTTVSGDAVPSYAKLKDDDVKALYAYFMHGVEPVKQANRPSDIPWPLNMRWPLALWNKVFLDTTPYADKPSGTWCGTAARISCRETGHCGSCPPRGVGFQEKALDEGGAAFHQARRSTTGSRRT